MKSWLPRVLYLLGFTAFLYTMILTLYFANKMTIPIEIDDYKISFYQYHFVLIPEEVENKYWKIIEKGALDAAKEYDVLLEISGPKLADPEEHIRKVKTAAATNVDGIITQGLATDQLPTLINNIVKKGIPIVTIDSDVPNSERSAYIGSDNYFAGFKAGQALSADMGGQANVAIFQYPHQKLRVKGFKDAVAHQPGIKIIALEESNVTRIRAAEKTYQILKNSPEVDAFFATSAQDGIGIADIVTQFNREKDTYIMAFDTLPDTIDYIKKGTIQATVMQEPYKMGYQAVEKLIKLKKGEKLRKIDYTDTKVIRSQDIAKGHWQ